jgi:hypothetical protein
MSLLRTSDYDAVEDRRLSNAINRDSSRYFFQARRATSTSVRYRVIDLRMRNVLRLHD